jgi:hypothetical protein
MARRKGAARADGKRRGSSSPPRKASGRVCGIAWQGQVRSGCREWRVARATRRRKAPSTAPACRRRTRVAVGLGCPRRARRRAARSPRAVIPLTGRRQGPGRLGDTVRDSLNWRDLDDEGDDVHVGTAVPADLWQGLERACELCGLQIWRSGADGWRRPMGRDSQT